MPLFNEVPPRKAWLVGHRGAAGHAPENTMASFRRALSMGADFVECDVHLSRDGRCPVIHDETLERTTSGRGLVGKKTFRELRKLDAGSWFSKKFRGERIPSLDELLAWARRRTTKAGRPLGVFIEIKNHPVRYPGIEARILEVVAREKMDGRVVIISFDHAAVRRAKRLRPDIPAGILYSRPLDDAFGRARRMGADGLFARRTLITRRLVKAAHRRNLSVATWTVDDSSDMKRILACGAHAITTNFPDRLNRLLGGKR